MLKLKGWGELGIIGKLWRCAWVGFTGVLCVALFLPEAPQNSTSAGISTEQNVKQEKEREASLITAKVMRISNNPGHGLYWINTISMQYNGKLDVKLNRPNMKDGDIVYSHNDDAFDMIGASYFCDDQNSYYNNAHGTSERLTLTGLDYANKRAEFEFAALLQTNLRDKGTSIKVRFAIEGEDFDTAVKAKIIAPNEG